MIKITDNSELEVYPKGTGIKLAQQLRWLFVLPVMAVVAYVCHEVFGSVVALVAILLVSVMSFLWQRFSRSSSVKTLSSGMYRVSAGRVFHMAGHTTLAEFAHDGREATIDESGGRITLTLLDDLQRPEVAFTGFESRKEADVMLACLRGQKIGKRNATIRMS